MLGMTIVDWIYDYDVYQQPSNVTLPIIGLLALWTTLI